MIKKKMSSLKCELINITIGRKVITDVIQNKVIDLKFKDEILLSLLKYHPTKNILISNIEYLVIRLIKPYTKPLLFYKMIGSSIEQEISYMLCLRNLFEKI